MNSRQRRKAAAKRHNFLLDEAEAYAEDKRRFPVEDKEVSIEWGHKHSALVAMAIGQSLLPYRRR